MATSVSSSLETGHQDMIHDAQMDYFGKRLATCSSDKTVKLFEVTGDRHTLIKELRGHEGPVWEVAWSHPKFGGILASCSYDRKVIIWKETTTGWENVYEHRKHQSSVNSIAWAPHETEKLTLACGSSDGRISIISPNSEGTAWDTSKQIEAHDRGVTSVSWAPHQIPLGDGSEAAQQFVSGGCDNVVKLWTWEKDDWKGEKIGEHKDWVRDVAWAPGLGVSTHTVASCSQNGELCIWQQEPSVSNEWVKKRLAKYEGCPIWRVSWSVTGNILAVSSADNKVTLWKESLDGEWSRISAMDDPAGAS